MKRLLVSVSLQGVTSITQPSLSVSLLRFDAWSIHCLTVAYNYNCNNQINDVVLGGHVACTGKKKNVYKILVGKSEPLLGRK